MHEGSTVPAYATGKLARSSKLGRAVCTALAVVAMLPEVADAQQTLRFANDKVSLVLPEGFERMSKELVDQKFQRGNTPEHVFSNARTTVSVAARYTPNAGLTLERLAELKTFMETTLEQNTPGLQWISRDTIEVAGQPWIRLELQANAFDTEIRNVVLITALDGGMVAVNFNSTVGEYQAYRERLEQSQASIAIRR